MSGDYQYILHVRLSCLWAPQHAIFDFLLFRRALPLTLETQINLPDGKTTSVTFGAWTSLDDVRTRIVQISPTLAASLRQSKKIQFTLGEHISSQNANFEQIEAPAPNVPAEAVTATDPTRSVDRAATPTSPTRTLERTTAVARKLGTPLTQRAAQYPLQPPLSVNRSPNPFPPAPSRLAVSIAPASAKQGFRAERRRSKSYDQLPGITNGSSPKTLLPSATHTNIQRPVSRDRSVSTTPSATDAVSRPTSADPTAEVPDGARSPFPRPPAGAAPPVLEVSSPLENQIPNARPRSFNWNTVPTKTLQSIIVNPTIIAEMKSKGSPNLAALGISYAGATAEGVLFAQTVSAYATTPQLC